MAPDEEKAPSKASNRAEVVFQGVTMAFGNRTVLNNMSCRFPPGKITVISGGNGMGKSTTLRIIGGLIYPSSGTVLVGGQNVGGLNAKGWREVRSNIGMMFQRGALLDSTTVFDNIAFPLREHTDLNSE
ncbi:MAG: ATP-binding cassette domain-containing protein, partial [Planctomycetota bacterium]|nr:ATP-binding cassette domain-containing protein [Planctomycetota bacterium]